MTQQIEHVVVPNAITVPTIRCASCGKRMIVRYGKRTQLDAFQMVKKDPDLWWCACGHTEPFEPEPPKSDEEILMESWEHVNQEVSSRLVNQMEVSPRIETGTIRSSEAGYEAL